MRPASAVLRSPARRAAAALLALAAACGTAVAQPAIEWSGSGFATLAAGRILSGRADPTIDPSFRCPCFISDYAQGGVYEHGRVRVAPDSKLGLQGSAFTEDKRFGATGQLVFRGAADGEPNVEWVYATWNASPSWTVQAGRMRLPLFSYSQVQDVGFALPWIHLPPQLYGWEVVNFDGASVQWRASAGEWTVSANAFGGTETRRDSGYWTFYNGKDSRTDSRWRGIVGVEAKLGWGPWEARAIQMRSDTQNRRVSDGEASFSDPKRQRIDGVSFGWDRGDWFARLEVLAIDRTADYGRDRAQLVAVGHRTGPWTLTASGSNYRQLPNEPDVAEAHRTVSAVVRYDLGSSSAVKAQLDRWIDRSDPGFRSIRGDSTLLTISYDIVF